MPKLRDIKRERYIGLVVDATDPKNVKLIRDELNLNSNKRNYRRCKKI